MHALDRWMHRQSARAQGIVCLEDALLANRFLAYAFYRLRFFLGRALLDAVVHLIEFSFLLFIFEGQRLIAALLVRTAGSLLNSWWWGGLEVMRQRIRMLQRERKTHRIPRTVGVWMGMALSCAAAAALLAVGWVAFDTARASTRFNILHAFVLATAVRVAVGFLTRTYHSGIFALCRVYRPFVAIVVTDLAGAVGTVALWPWLAAYAFPCVSVASALLAGGLTYVYVRRMYAFLGIGALGAAIRLPSRKYLRLLWSREFHMAGMSNAVMALDGALIFILACGLNGQPREEPLFLLFYLIAPFVRASHDWVRLFYFDLKRLDLDHFANLRRLFVSQIAQTAIGVGLLFWLLASLTGTVGLGKNLGWLYALLAALFLVRARLAFCQVNAFSQKRYGALVASGILTLAAVLISCGMASGRLDRLAMLAAGMLPAIGCLKRSTARHSRTRESEPLLPATVWISQLVAIRGSVRVRTVRLARGTRPDVANHLAESISRRIGPCGQVTIVKGRWVAWFEQNDFGRMPDEAWLLSRGAGWIESVDPPATATDGRRALRSAQRTTKFLGKLAPNWLDGKCTLDRGTLVERFHHDCGNGMVWAAGRRGSGEMAGLSSGERREIMRLAVAHARGAVPIARGSAFDVTTLCDGGEIKLIFASPRQPGRGPNAAWRSWIDSVNIRCAFGARVLHKETFNMSFIRMHPAATWVTVLGTILSTVSAVKITDTVPGNFQLDSAARSELRAPAAAFVKAVHAGEGDTVSSGSDLIQLDVPDLPSRIAASKARLREVNADLRLLETGARQVEIAEQRGIVRQSDAKAALARTAVEQSRLALQQKLASLDKQSAQWKAELDFALRAYQRKKGLVDTQAVSKDDFEQSIKEVRVCRARVEQIDAERQMFKEAGTMRAEGDLARAEKELAEARAKLALLEAGSRDEEIEAARARRDAIQQELAYLEQLAGQLVLTSQIRGVVTTPGIDGAVGQYFREGELICEVEDLSVMQACISIGENDATRVLVGQLIRLKFRALPFQVFHATIESVSPATAPVLQTGGPARPVERTMVVSCRVEDEKHQLRPGMSGYARIALGRASLGSIALHRVLRFVRTEFWW